MGLQIVRTGPPNSTVNARYNGPGYSGQNLAYTCKLLELLRHYECFAGRAIAQAVRCCFPTATARVLARVSLCGICGRQSGIG
jgi:hypothetical protein